ncbi:MAG: YfiR family protein [Magnetococcales bacterium]|nr:YfiR family protein [Magnetococcales bacterium]
MNPLRSLVRRLRPLWMPTTLTVVVIGMSALHANPPSEAQLKGAYLYQFTRFVTWPASAFAHDRDPFRLCVFGPDTLGPILNALGNKSVGSHPIAIRHPDTPADTLDCHLLFVARSEHEHLPAILATLQEKPVLTVGDQPEFASQGGMIHFMRVNDTLRFTINQEVALQSGLTIHATLLQVGHVLK